MIMVLTLVGVYSVNNSVFDIWVMLGMGIFGYFARKLKFDLGPLLLAFVLGPIMERSLRQALLMSGGSAAVFFTRPISGALMGVAILFLLSNAWASRRRRKREAQEVSALAGGWPRAPGRQADTAPAGLSSSIDGKESQMKSLFRRMLATAVVALAATTSALAAYPDKPIQLIVPYGAGGSTDLLARAIAQVAPKYFPQPLVVVNKGGGGGIPGRVDVARSKPDGYTLLFGWGSGEDLVVPHERPLPYNLFKDFETVCRMSIHSIVLAVPASSPYMTLADLVKAGKTKGNLTAAVSTKGASVDITFLLFGKAAGIKVTTIPGSGGASAITNLVGGHVDFGGGHPSEVLPHIKAGRLRALAVALESRDATIPDVPTFREAGYDVVTAGSVKGVAVAAGTPKEVVAYLEKKFKEIADDPEFQKIMKDIGQPVNYQNAAEYTVWFKQAYDQFGMLYKTLGIETK
jgi:tripartite-type tricarboxylate transporter receptor subunit TctC